jgi:hypothetical protein
MKHKGMAIAVVSLLMVGVTGMNVFAFFGLGGTNKWQEEVKLSDGRIIVVERQTLTERGGDEWAANRAGTKTKEHRIVFQNPDHPGKTVEWRSTKTDARKYPEKPLILDLEAGEPVVFTILANSKTTQEYSKYLYRNGSWIEEKLPDEFEKRNTNLYLPVGKGLIDLETKRLGNAQTGYDLNLREVGPKRKVPMDRRR